MISSLHGLYDDRIYWKEALTLKQAGYDVIHLGVDGHDSDIVSDHGIRLISVTRKRYFPNPYLDIVFRKLTFRPSVYKRLYKICQRLKADVYHFHDFQLNRIGPALKKLLHKPAVIYDVHEDYYEQIINHASGGIMRFLLRIYAGFVRRQELKCCRHYDAIITVVPHIAEYFIKAAGKEKVHVIYNYTAMKPAGNVDDDSKIYDAVYAGMVNQARGGEQIIKAAAIAKQEFSGLRVLLVGPVPDPLYERKLKSLIIELGLQENVILREPVPYSGMEHLLRQCRIGLGIFMPVSIFNFGIQVKTFEYMVCGLPIVCSDSGNIGRIITENNCGITVNPRSPSEIAAAITTLINDNKLYNILRRNGINAVKDKYQWEE